MGFEVFLQSFPETSPSGCVRSEIWNAFIPWIVEESSRVWRIQYDSMNVCTAYLDDEEHVEGLMIGRPCYDIRLWDSLFRIMRMGNYVILWPGMIKPLVADTCPTAQLPPKMIEDFGGLISVSSGQEICTEIEANTRRLTPEELERLKKLWQPDDSR